MKISTRQSQVLAWMCQGMMNKEIAQQMGISEHTVRDHISAMLKQCGCRTRVALIAYAVARRGQAPIADIIAQRPATSNQQPATSNQQPATSNQQSATGDRRQATGDRRQATGDQNSVAHKPVPPTNVALHL